jgi:ankyrin repeat protein
LEELHSLLQLMKPVNPKGKPCKYLAAAVCDANPNLVKEFLDAGADVNQALRIGSPVLVAAQHGKLDHLDLLLKAGAKDIPGALERAAREGQIAAMRRLFEEPLDPEKHGAKALATAAYHNQLEAVKLLVEKGVPIGANRHHAVSEAARNASMDVLKFFFASGVKPEHAGHALRAAAGSPLCFVSVKFLVEAGVDPTNHPHYSFNSVWDPLDKPELPADVAAEQNKPEVADYLRGKQIDVEALLAREEERRKSSESNKLDDAFWKQRHEEKTAHLLKGGARADAVKQALALINSPAIKPVINQCIADQTALGLAAENGDVEIVEALLKAGADPKLKDGALQTPPIYHAVSNGHAPVAEKLLKAGADPNAKNRNGEAPLVEAADWGDPEMVRMLLDAGADPKIKNDNSGFTAMSVEPGLQRWVIKEMLREAVKKRAGGKPEKGQGLSFIGKKKVVNLAVTRGVQDFRKFYYDSHPEWSVAFAREEIGKVAKSYHDIVKPVRWEMDIARKKVEPARRFVYLLQLKDSPWTIVLRSLGSCVETDKEMKELSKQLDTRVYTFMAEDKSGAEAYDLFEKGDLAEKAIQCGEITFESRLRHKPQFDADKFPDPVFADENIYLPVCYPENDGYNIKLVLKGLESSQVARADFIGLEE